MLKYGFVIAFFSVIVICKAEYEDGRCKCICSGSYNKTMSRRQVYTRIFADPADCNCMHMVNEAVKPPPEDKSAFCAGCECQWQTRNTTTIKVVVILIICVISMLVLYMLFLLCLDPLMNRRPKTYLEQRNEEDTQSQSRILPESTRPATGVISRVKHEVNRVRADQQKWKGTVQEQRRNIFDRHIMLD